MKFKQHILCMIISIICARTCFERLYTHYAQVNDCSAALDLLKPPCEGNRRSRAKCIARRGAALARLGYLSKAIDEMKAASKLLPDDEKIKTDVYNMERAWEQNPDSE